MAEMMGAPEAQPGMSEGQVPGGEAAPKGPSEGDAGTQLRDLIGGVQDGLGLVRTIMESTPDAPEEAKGLLDSAQESFMQAMKLMVQGDDETAAEPEVPVAAEAGLANKPRIVQKGFQA